MKQSYVEADPYRWPYNGDLRPQNTLFLVIDMQIDFCGKGGYVDKMGYDLSLTRAPIRPIQNVLAATRSFGSSGKQTMAQQADRRGNRRSWALRTDSHAR
jgi:biuret amidohydrolase